jgi:hypothetical protein
MAGPQQVASPTHVQRFLKGLSYPGGKAELIATARRHGADESVMTTLGYLPDQTYDSPNDVAEAIARLERAR